MAGHRRAYNRYKNEKTNFTSVYALFEEYGNENCKIELVELYPSNTKDELLARESHHQRENDCINKILAKRTKQEYQQDNKRTIQEYKKQYIQDNKEKLNERHRQYYNDNKEYLLEQKKIYWQENKSQIQEKRKTHNIKESVQVSCECGANYVKRNTKRHIKTKKHQQYLNSLNQQEPTEEL